MNLTEKSALNNAQMLGRIIFSQSPVFGEKNGKNLWSGDRGQRVSF